MSDLGVLVPILSPTGFSTRQSAASNIVEDGDRLGVSQGTLSASAFSDPDAAAAPLVGVAPTGFAAGLVAVLQETDDDDPNAPPGQAGEDGDGDSAGEVEGDGAEASEATGTPETNGTPGTNLTPEQQQVVAELQRTDAEVRRHEQAHAAAGGRYAGAPSYDYTRGPDGRLYAIGGDVQIDVAVVPGNPEATIQKMRTVRRAALAPANPSPQDRRVAAIAQQRIAEALREKSQLELEERQEAAAERSEAQERAERLQPAPASELGAAGISSGQGPAATAGAVFNIIA